MNESNPVLYVSETSRSQKDCICLHYWAESFTVTRMLNVRDVFLFASIMFCATVLLPALLFTRQISALYE